MKFVFAALIVVITTIGCSGGEGDSMSKSDEAAAKQAQADAKSKFSQLSEEQKQQLKQAMAKSPGNAN